MIYDDKIMKLLKEQSREPYLIIFITYTKIQKLRKYSVQ